MWTDAGGIPWDQQWPDFSQTNDGKWEKRQMENFKKNMLAYDLPDQKGIFVIPKSEEEIQDPKDSYGPNVSLQQVDLSQQKTPEELRQYKNWKCSAHLSQCDLWMQQRNQIPGRMSTQGKVPQELARKIAHKSVAAKEKENKKKKKKTPKKTPRETYIKAPIMEDYETSEDEQEKEPPPGVNRITWDQFLRFVT